MPRRNKSFYNVEFSVLPGGAHKDVHYIRGTLDEIKADLAKELDDQLNLYLLCCYGARLELHVVEKGVVVHNVDLHTAITIEAAGYPAITFAGSKKPIGYTFNSEDNDSLGSRMFDRDLDGVKVLVDWSKVDVPSKLPGKRVAEGDFVAIHGDWQDDDDDMDDDELIDCGYIPYGFSDSEE